MQLLIQASLLFTLNLLDAVLTIYWIRNGFATEGNQLMAGLLNIGNIPFLAVKVSVGALAAVVLWRWRHLRLAKIGLAVSLSVYVFLMGVHLFTGLSAFGYLSDSTVYNIAHWTEKMLASFI
ncbi:MAG: DUF5658 family protein [Pyrinomonadaceae bacterium]